MERRNRRRNTREVALWAGVAAFCTNVVALKALTAIASGDVRIGLSALLTSLCVGGAVYAKERLNAARRGDSNGNSTPPE